MVAETAWPMMRRASVPFVLLTIVIDTLGFSIVLPVMPKLITLLTHADLGTAARYGGILFSAYAVAQFLFAPLIGNLSDRFGRRPVLLASLGAFTVDYTLLGFAPSIGWLFAGRIIAGIAGATYACATAVVSDITPPEKRAKLFGAIGAAFGIGFIIGPGIGALLANFGPRAPFLGAAVLAGLNFLFGLFFVGESLPVDQRRPLEARRLNPLGAFVELRKRPKLTPLLTALFLWQLSFTVFPSTWAYYCTLVLGWGPQLIGFSLALSGVCVVVVQGGLVARSMKKLGERRTLVLGAVCGTLAFIGYGMATQSWGIFLLLIFGAGSFLYSPAINALLSSMVPNNEQGELQGVIACANGVTMVIGPLLASQLFAAFSRPEGIYLPGAAFFAAALFACVAAIISWFATRNLSRRRSGVRVTA